jgi:ATP-dependent Clp protease adaptor protein ClpS
MSDKRKEQGDSSVLERERIDEPKKYKVILLNDHYTTMEFVVHVLKTVFRQTSAQATRTMLHIHNNGVGTAGIYMKEIAETKIAQTHDLAREAGHPLQCEMEPE